METGLKPNVPSDKVLSAIHLLEEKYKASGQDLLSYLEGLLYNDFLTYWDYIHLDTLLSLQAPKTSFPDESIFIMFHQSSELYFKMILQELHQICAPENNNNPVFFYERIKRVNRYFNLLVEGFDVMVDGMEPAQFLKFRMSLLPASGFQSGQFRLIEIIATNFINLVTNDKRDVVAKGTIEEQYQYIYWKDGATELSTGAKTLTLQKFEEKYTSEFLSTAANFCGRTLRDSYLQFDAEGDLTGKIKAELRLLDSLVNVNWRLVHYKSAVRYLYKEPEIIAATGGTNWQKYLPPRFQRRIFFPELWNEDEKADWGKGFVVKMLNELSAT